MKRRVFAKAVLSAGALVLALASLGWACTNQARIITLNSLTGPPATALSLTGNRVAPLAAVEVRWNALNGPKIGAAVADQAGNFATQVTVPQVSPGIYTIVASAGEFAVARTAFEVTAPATGKVTPATVRQIASNDLWKGFAGDNGAAGAISAATSQSGNKTGMAAGIGLLAASLAAACFAGAFVFSSRRRRTADGGGDDKGGKPMV